MRCWSVSALGARGHRSFSCTTPRTTGSMVQSDARRRSGKARRVVWPSWSGRVDRRPLASTRRARAASCSAISGGRLGRTMAREHGHGAQHYPAEPRRSMSLARVPRVAVERLRVALPEPWSRSSRRAGERALARTSPPPEGPPGAVRRALLSAPLSPSDGRAGPLPRQHSRAAPGGAALLCQTVEIRSRSAEVRTEVDVLERDGLARAHAERGEVDLVVPEARVQLGLRLFGRLDGDLVVAG